ncbi:hypothetical protein FALCPG4_006662 [Fusarium falciforme]
MVHGDMYPSLSGRVEGCCYYRSLISYPPHLGSFSFPSVNLLRPFALLVSLLPPPPRAQLLSLQPLDWHESPIQSIQQAPLASLLVSLPSHYQQPVIHPTDDDIYKGT